MAKRESSISQQDQAGTQTVSLQTDERSSPLSELRTLLAQQPFFHGIDTRQLGLLAGLAMEMQFRPGEYIFKQGDPANRFYMLLEGEVALELESKGGGRVPIRLAGPGTDLGWFWLFEPFYFPVSARVTEPTRVIFFYGTMLRQYCEDDHEFGHEIMQRIAQAVVRSFTASRQSLLKSHQAPAPEIGLIPGKQVAPTQSST